MFKQKALRNPLRPAVPKLPTAKDDTVIYQKPPQLVFQDNNQAKDPLSISKDGSDSAASNGSSSDFETEMQFFEDSCFGDPRYYRFRKNVAALQDKLNQNGSKKPFVDKSAKVTPVFLKPLDEQKLKESLILADGGEEGYASGDVRYDPKTDRIVPRVKLETALPGVTGENSDAVDILADMPEDFNFTGWDDKTAKQQQKELQNAGVNPKDQMVLLNSATSLETLAMIQEISNNRREYGLTVLDVERISKELLQISNARVGAKNHDIPLGVNPATRNTFLAMLNEKEQALLASFGFGTVGQRNPKNPSGNIGDQITDLLQSDHSISNLLHGDSDVYQAADQFFNDMGKLDSIISDINNGKIEFTSPQEKQRYLNYLSNAYKKNDNLYRNMLASEIDEAGLLQFPEWRLKQLVNDLSLTQLEGLVAQIDANGLRKLSRPGSFDKLMKILLSDTDSALNLVADETKSPICPYVFNGIDVVNQVGIQISGYYYEDGVYKGKITCPDQEPFYFEIGKKLPEEVAISVSYADWWDISSDIAWREVTSLRGITEIAFQGITGMPGVQRPLPEPIGPTDVPGLGEAIAEADWSNQYKTLQEGSIIISIFVHFPKDHITDYHYVEFYRN